MVRGYIYIDMSSSPEIPDFGGERLFSGSKHILERLSVRWTFIKSDVRGSGGEVRWLLGTY